MRLGYAVGSAEVIDWLRTVGGPYPTSTIGLALAEALLARGDSVTADYLARVRRERDALRAIFEASGVETWPSQANFILIRTPCAAALREALGRRGIAVRAFREPALLRDCLRITCPGDEPVFDRLTAALDSILNSQEFRP
jgi:histidinol-phosphate/aromatic aminotransferase/cobyric acid decarboxylase-like protein